MFVCLSVTSFRQYNTAHRSYIIIDSAHFSALSTFLHLPAGNLDKRILFVSVSVSVSVFVLNRTVRAGRSNTGWINPNLSGYYQNIPSIFRCLSCIGWYCGAPDDQNSAHRLLMSMLLAVLPASSRGDTCCQGNFNHRHARNVSNR